VFRNVDLVRLIAILRAADFPLLALALVPLVIERVVRPYRLALLLNALPSLRVVIAAQSVAQFVNLILPLRSGEMFLVVALRALTPVSGSYALSIVVIDRLLDIVMVLLVFAAAVVAVPELPAIADRAALSLTIVCGAVVAGMLLLVVMRDRFAILARRVFTAIGRGHLENWLTRLQLTIDGFATLLDLRRLVVALGATVITWMMATIAAWLVLKGIGADVSIAAAALAICLGVFGVTLVSLPAGVGVTHAAFALAIMVFGGTQETALAFAVIYHGMASMVTAAMGLAFMSTLRRAGLRLWRRSNDA
jgi:uncharacterized protein (TIRG00374 family)